MVRSGDRGRHERGGGRPAEVIVNDIRAFIGFFRSQRSLIVAATVISFASSVVEAALLLVLVPLAQSLVTPDAEPVGIGPFTIDADPDRLLVIALVLALATAAGSLAANFCAVRAAARWQRSTRMRLFRAFQGASWAAQSQDRAGKLITLSAQNVNQGAAGLSLLITGLGALISLVVLATTSFIVSPLGALLMIVGGGVLFAALRPLGRRAKKLNKELAALNKTVNGEVSEWVSFARDVRVFDVGDQTEARVGALVGRHEHLRRTTQLLAGSLNPLYRLGGILLVLFVVFVATRVDSVTAASLGAAALLIYRSLGYGQSVQRTSHAVQETLPHLSDLEHDLGQYEADVLEFGSVELTSPKTIEYRKVGYRYDRRLPAVDGLAEELAPDPVAASVGRDALIDVSLTMELGQIVGVVGPSGSGKSTLAQLLLRLREPTSGEVDVDGVDARSFSESSWRRQIALVPQEAHLLHGTVAENIAFLRPWVDRSAVEQAARDAGIHDEILALPDGFDTAVGASTRDLSGGQVQRISIARALAGSPSVLVLDEPTSALDVHSESIVQDTIESLRHRMLVVIIAHRLTTLSICDRLVVLRAGVVEAVGPPNEVMASSTFFAMAGIEPT
jgi:ATP-binding cassette, subfamily B, bacterial